MPTNASTLVAKHLVVSKHRGALGIVDCTQLSAPLGRESDEPRRAADHNVVQVPAAGVVGHKLRTRCEQPQEMVFAGLETVDDELRPGCCAQGGGVVLPAVVAGAARLILGQALQRKLRHIGVDVARSEAPLRHVCAYQLPGRGVAGVAAHVLQDNRLLALVGAGRVQRVVFLKPEPGRAVAARFLNPAFESGAHEVLHGVGPALSRVAVGSLSEQRGTHTLVTNTARRRRRHMRLHGSYYEQTTAIADTKSKM